MDYQRAENILLPYGHTYIILIRGWGGVVEQESGYCRRPLCSLLTYILLSMLFEYSLKGITCNRFCPLACRIG